MQYAAQGQDGLILIPEWPAPKNIVAFTTLRNTQISNLKLPSEPVFINQVHGAEVVQADLVSDPQTKADASFTSSPNIICVVKTADCLPILICDQAGAQVAAIHAGWRSLASGIIANTCAQFKAPKRDLLVWLGPSIGPDTFEVGKDVLDSFAQYGWQDPHLKSSFVASKPGKWLGNLCNLARITLQEQGIPAENIYGGDWCTYSDPARFYSYRRSPADLGRMLSLIWRI
jgi:YfiH family protein